MMKLAMKLAALVFNVDLKIDACLSNELFNVDALNYFLQAL